MSCILFYNTFYLPGALLQPPAYLKILAYPATLFYNIPYRPTLRFSYHLYRALVGLYCLL